MRRDITASRVFLCLTFAILTGCGKENPTNTQLDPTASFTWSGDSLTPTRIRFENRSENADEFFWNFGDGTTSPETNPVHIYSEPKTYLVTLKATQSGTGSARVASQYLTITTDPPAVDFSWSGDTIASSAISFQNLTRNADTFRWDFGDGDTSLEINPVHVFHEAGTFSVTLTASLASSRQTGSITKTISIFWADPIADFDWTGETIVGSYVTLHNRSQYADEFLWKTTGDWFSSDTDPRLLFEQPGNYPISLIARNSALAKSDTVTKVLAVSPLNVSLVMIRINQIPWADSLGHPWDPDGGPDIIIIMYDPNGQALLGGGDVLLNLTSDQLPVELIPESPAELVRSREYRIDFHDLGIGVAPYGRLVGQVYFCIDALRLAQGFRGVYAVDHDSMKVDIGVEWH